MKWALCVILLSAASRMTAQTATGEPRQVEWGFEQRVRNENWNNLLDYSDAVDDQRVQVRYRTRVWMSLPVTADIDVFAGVNQETNQVIVKRAPYRLDEAVFETAYVDFKKLFVKGLSLRVGRQNLMKGEGFLMLEGNPFDGSRSIYFNAANLAYTWKKSKIELMAISDPYTDRYLPRIHDRSKPLIEWNERAIGAYYTDKNHRNTELESYYFYKKETNDTRNSANAQFQPDRHIHTAGARIVRQLPRHWSATGEFAVQWGRQHPDTRVRGWGGYGYAKRTFAMKGKPYLQAGWWGLSGDDPKTKGIVEGWDPLFSRWPKWSELYIYTLWKEKGVAYWTNLGMWQAEAGYSPTKALTGRFTYYRMNAFQPFAGNQQLYGSGTLRGDHYQARLDCSLGKHWKGHVLYERLAPGNFYATPGKAYFLRFEAIFLLRGNVKL